MSDFVVPDMIEPIVAWRCWNFHDALHSLNHSARWEPKERMEARCNHAEPTVYRTAAWEAFTDWLVEDSVFLSDLNTEDLHRFQVQETGGGYPGYQTIRNGAGQMYATVPMYSSSVATFYSSVDPEEVEPLEDPALILPPMWHYRVGFREVMYPPRHGACPDEGCTCGIYALDTRQALESQYPGSDVIGEVYLWGKVIDGERGYRAQFAYPKSLYINPRRSGAIDEGTLSAYGVPINEPSKTQVAVSYVLPQPGRYSSIMATVNLVVIGVGSTGFFLGVMAWWNVALLAANAAVVVAFSRRARRIVLSAFVIAGLLTYLIVSLPIALPMVLIMAALDITGQQRKVDWFMDHNPYQLIDWTMDRMGW